MKCISTFLILLCGVCTASFAQLQITFPVKRIVFQRNTVGSAPVTVAGNCDPIATKVEARFVAREGQGTTTVWTSIPVTNGKFQGTVTVQGGWYNLEVQSFDANGLLGTSLLERVGVGEVFIIAGQSNAQGRSDQTDTPIPVDDRINVISNFTNNETSNQDPSYPASFPVFDKMTQTGAYAPYGLTSWCWGHLGDLLTAQLKVPVLFINTAFSATGMYNWSQSSLGQSTQYPFASHITMPPGMPYANLKTSLQYYANLIGVRAVLWHQGEWDGLANTSTNDYYTQLRTTILQSRVHTGKNISWMIARASLRPDCGSDCPVINYIKNPGVIAGQNMAIKNVENCFNGPETDDIQNPRASNDPWHFSGAANHRKHAQAWYASMINSNFLTNSVPQLAAPMLKVTHTSVSPTKVTLTMPAGGTQYVWANSDNADAATTRMITGNTEVTYYGRSKDALGNSAFIPPFLQPSSDRALPVSLISFQATIRNKQEVELSWATASEYEASYFSVVRGTSTDTFESIGTVKAQGTTTSRHSYSLKDYNPGSGIVYYQLRQVDTDGTVHTHRTVSVQLEEKDDDIALSPNPNTGTEFTIISGQKPERISLYDSIGTEVRIESEFAEGKLKVHPSQQLQPGLYLIRVEKAHQITTKKLVVLY